MSDILVLCAHPNPQHSRANKNLIHALSPIENIKVRDLYQLYPDFDIHVQAEQAELLKAKVVVFLHPIYWYSCPALMKEWLDLVLQPGFAYGSDGGKLMGKKWLCAITTGGDEASYNIDGKHGASMDDILKPFERTAAVCSMEYLPPFVVHHVDHLTDEQLRIQAQQFVTLLQQYLVQG